jgi:hypothetical protein
MYPSAFVSIFLNFFSARLLSWQKERQGLVRGVLRGLVQSLGLYTRQNKRQGLGRGVVRVLVQGLGLYKDLNFSP